MRRDEAVRTVVDYIPECYNRTPMKIYMDEFNDYLGGLAQGEPGASQKAISGLAKYSGAEWETAPEAVTAAVQALVGEDLLRPAGRSDRFFRAEAAKALGNIGMQSPAVVPELIRILKDDADAGVRTEAARALGKIGEGAKPASKILAAVLGTRSHTDSLRGEAARALARVDPANPDTVAALRTAANDRSGHVGVCAAEALSRVTSDAGGAILALAARLGDLAVREAATQALYRIGPKAIKAVPALLAAAKDKNRLFHESVVMALRKIDPQAAAKAGMG